MPNIEEIRAEVLGELQNHLKRKIDPDGMRCFNWVFKRTILDAINSHADFDEGREFVLFCIKHIARCARKMAGESNVSWFHFARACNCQIPILRELCYAPKLEKNTEFMKGVYCKIITEVPEQPVKDE